MILLALIIIYLALVNWGAYRAFAKDKLFAISKEQRTPEVNLLFWARIGGWGGAKYAQQKLRHKSYKQPFGSRLNIIGMVHAMSAVTAALIFCVLGLAPIDVTVTPSRQTAKVSVQVSQPDPVPPLKSLRPPVAYRTGL